MSARGDSAIATMGLELVVAQMPAAVVVVEAPSGRILHANARANDMTERQLRRPLPPELTSDWEIFHLDGRPYGMEEWPLVRSITSGEHVVDEEYFNNLPDGGRMVVRCSSNPVYDDADNIVAGVLVMSDVTEQKERDERLGYLAGLLSNTEDAIVALDAEWYVTVWNRGAERMYGWTAAEVVGRHTLEVARLEMSDEDRAEVRRTVAERGRWRGEVVAYRKDGSAVCIELITVALRGERGELTGFLGIHRDVDERKRAEERLRDAKRQMETILESISDSFFALDREWRYTYVNERALNGVRSVRGPEVTASDILGRSCWELYPEWVGSVFDLELRRVLEEQRIVEFEALSPPTNSWFEVRAYPSKDGLAVFSRDISERKWALEEMARRAEQQALVADLGQRALASDDLQSLLDDAVRLVAATLGVELTKVAELTADGEELLMRAGLGWRKGMVGSEAEPVGDGSQAGYAIARGEAVVTEDLAAEERFDLSPVVREHRAASAASVVIDSRDGPFGVLGALSTRRRAFSPSDVSFMQAVANVIATAVERLRAEERLTEVREVERRRIARDLHDEALQDLTYALAIAGGGAPAGGGTTSDELRAALKRIGEHLRGAIYDLRLGGQEYAPFPELLDSLVDVHRAMAAGCDIDLDMGDGVPRGPLGATGVEVLRILGEALTNTRTHARARHVRVGVWVTGATLRAEVSDDGEGFDPASRSHSTNGHGLGGMRERADRLRGRLEILSEPTAGTTVRLDVPLDTAGTKATEQVRVLLVEDHIAVREAIAAAFERNADFSVVGQAASLAEARGMLEGVDVAVLDLGLPDGSGADLIAELHEVDPRAQALVLSATLDRADVARAVEGGAAGALDKTARLDEVVDAVRRLRAGETLLPLDEVVELLRFAGREREQKRADREAIARLTPRERELLQALADGLDSQRIADRLQISVRTERNHVASILAKLEVHSRLQALVLALRYEIVEIR
jgi:PAS domain S-box-containing protein